MLEITSLNLRVHPQSIVTGSSFFSPSFPRKSLDQFHLNESSYHDTQDARIPDQFHCYPCRVILDPSNQTTDQVAAARKVEVERALNDLSGLCLFRRSIALFWEEGILGQKDLATRLGAFPFFLEANEEIINLNMDVNMVTNRCR